MSPFILVGGTLINLKEVKTVYAVEPSTDNAAFNGVSEPGVRFEFRQGGSRAVPGVTVEEVYRTINAAASIVY